MTKEEFYKRYANLPLGIRDKVVSVRYFGMMTWSDIYRYMHELDEKMRPHKIDQDDILKKITTILIAADSLNP
jgi:hypothetical protein